MYSDLAVEDPSGGDIFDQWDPARRHMYLRRSGGPEHQLALMGLGDKYAAYY